MIDSSDTDSLDTLGGDVACATCNGPPLGDRYVQAAGSYAFIFCTEGCLRAALRDQRRRRWAARLRHTKALAVGITLVGACLTRHQGPAGARRVAHAAIMPVTVDSGPPPLPAGWFGPEWPPTEMSLLAALGQDAWVHPLSGPVRRMPRSDSRVFGAVRPGDRAIECRNGHCGVDLGGEIWGEHVHAVHDGVVDRVKRGINPDHGGQYVRISHRNGTVFTQYFHLAAIRSDLERGTPVKGGEVIGLLGDTGVKQSEPHLHFAMSIRPGKDWPEKYIDPEPLVALWPLRVPLESTDSGLVNTLALPGMPLGSAPLHSGAKRKLALQKRAAERAGKKEQGAAAEATPDDEGESAPEPEASEETSTED